MFGDNDERNQSREWWLSTYSLAETFDIGMDTGTQVSRIYDDPFIFNGELDRVTIRLND